MDSDQTEAPSITEVGDGVHISVPAQGGGLEILSRKHTRVVRLHAHPTGKPICTIWVDGGGELALAVSAMELLAALGSRPK